MSFSRYLDARVHEAYAKSEAEKLVTGWIQSNVDTLSSYVNFEELHILKRFRGEDTNKDVNYSETIWGKMLENPDIADIDTRIRHLVVSSSSRQSCIFFLLFRPDDIIITIKVHIY
jgi:hypothetical protein